MKNILKKGLAFCLTLMLLTTILPMATIAAADDETADPYKARFMEMWQKIHDPANGYFSADGIPYHSVETLIIEAPDYGHLTTSEAVSYYIWLEAMYGKFTGDFSYFERAWDITEEYIIPSDQDQPESSMSTYNPDSPASYAPEWELPDNYPAELDFDAAVGVDPINDELVSAYGTSQLYGMHWLIDVDNWYGYGQRGDGTSSPSFINSFQRGEQESVWETVPQPCWDDMTYGGANGYLDLFTGDSNYAQQFKYTNAPDADARAVQATYNAYQWAQDYGVDLSTYIDKASMMGDSLRYALFDKYYREIGDPSSAGTGYDSAHYLFSWYYAWGGGVSSDWSWIIGSSHNHFGYQNPMAAWILSEENAFKPASTNAARDWGDSLDRQLEFYQWLQSDEGAIAGGASNSNNGRYEPWPSGTATFYGMGYEPNPVYHDPGSNTWFGMQAWSMQRVAEYYYRTNDTRAAGLLDKWVDWVIASVQINADGTFALPSTLSWSGQPDTWTGSYTGNTGLHVSIDKYSQDLGVAGSLSNTLLYYSKATGDDDARILAEELLTRTAALYTDSKGVASTEVRDDYHRFFDQVIYIPDGWTGTMPNGDTIQSGVHFNEIRSNYEDDPQYQYLLDSYTDGVDPEFEYHRFWAQCDVAIANGIHSILFGDGSVPVENASISPTSATFDKNLSEQADMTIDMVLNGNTFDGIHVNDIPLVEGTDYAVVGTQVIISKDYLATNDIGTLELVFDFSMGIDPVLSIEIEDTTPSASITPLTATFDKNPETQEDIVVTVAYNGQSLDGLSIDGTVLTAGSDYSVSGDTITLPATYLDTLEVGDYSVIFDMATGIDPVLALTVIDTAAAPGALSIEAFNANTNDETNGISPKVKLTNTGDVAVDLKDVTIRYYYTLEGTPSQTFWCDWSSVGGGNVTATFVPMSTPTTDANYYLEIGFTEDAGTLYPGSFVEVQGRFSKSDWSSYTQTNDYSFSDASTYGEASQLPAYINNTLKWGMEP